jgi:hypothetical protein
MSKEQQVPDQGISKKRFDKMINDILFKMIGASCARDEAPTKKAVIRLEAKIEAYKECLDILRRKPKPKFNNTGKVGHHE